MKAITTVMPTLLPNNWAKTNNSYTGNDVIDAYLSGKEVGKDEAQRRHRDEFLENLAAATTASEKLLKMAWERAIHLEAIHLKADQVSNFTALFVSNLQDYLSDQFRDVYVIAQELKKASRKDTFDIYFSFTHNSPYPSQELLASDGFFLQYAKKSGIPKTRIAQ